MNEKTVTTQFDSHHTYHPAWAARILTQTRPPLHVDISSTLLFCAMVSAFIPVEFYDYRPSEVSLSGLESKRGDLTRLPFANNSVESLSCVLVVEHFSHANVGVRKSNSGQQQTDWQAYRDRWVSVFPSSNKIKSDWIYRSYADPFCTVARFPKVPSMAIRLLWLLRSWSEKLIA
ncbi:MAG: hypothetical protein IMZ53_09135 [Thermoplasmata archaeon]|nr:hypothetical protein [Thermoplasmata archaeon]